MWLLLVLCTTLALAGRWDIDLHPLEGTTSFRADLLGPEATVANIVACATVHPPTAASHCSTRGFARIPLKTGRTAVVDVVGNFYYLVEYTLATGERFIKEIPTKHEHKAVSAPIDPDARPWYPH